MKKCCSRTFLPACLLGCIFIVLAQAAETHSAVSWLAERSVVESALLETGRATLEFRSSRELTAVNVWSTPSLAGLRVSPSHFATIVPDRVYSLTLELVQQPAEASGGTILLRDASASRIFASPLPLDLRAPRFGGPDPPAQPPVAVTRVTASTDYRTGSVSPRQTLSIFGEGLGPTPERPARLDADGRLSTYLGDTQVFFNGIAAPILAVTPSQVNVVVPSGIAGDRTVEILVTHKGRLSQTITLPVEPYSPALFTLGGDGRGQSAALNRDGSLNSTFNRAVKGSLVSLFGSGFGEFSVSVPDGAIVDAPPPVLRNAVSVTIGGVGARVVYAGAAPGIVSGVVQINIEVPMTVLPGAELAVTVAVGGKVSPAWATLAVR